MPTLFHFLLPLALLTLFTGNAQAEKLNEKELTQLRTLSELGQQACREQNYVSCQRSFEQAQELLPWAPHEFYIAEALVGQGRLVEGSALWSKILKENDPHDCHPSVCQAVRQARLRLNEVEPQIPRVAFNLAGDYSDLRVEWDGVPLTQTQLAAQNRMNPGKYRLVVSAAGHHPLRKTYTLVLGEQHEIPILLSALPAPSADRTSPALKTETPRAWPVPVGITLGIAGGAALLTGALTWNSKQSKLESYQSACAIGPPHCNPEDKQAAEIEALTTLSNSLFIGGGALLAAGTGVLVWHWSSFDAAAGTRGTALSTDFGPQHLNMSVSGAF